MPSVTKPPGLLLRLESASSFQAPPTAGQGLVNLKNMLRIPLIGWAGFLCVFNVFHGKMHLEQPLHPQVTSLVTQAVTTNTQSHP